MKWGGLLATNVILCALGALVWAGTAAAATGEIHGKVTDHLGDPIAGITVCAEGIDELVDNECDWDTDAEGNYSIGGLEAASYRVGFHVENGPSLNFAQQWYSGKDHPEEADPVALAEGGSKEVDAVLQAGGEIRGTVAAMGTEDPIPGVRVCAELVGFFQTGEVRYCGRSDATGAFTVKNLGTGDYRLEFQTEGHVNFVEEQMPEAPGSIPLTAGGAIEVEAHLLPGIELDGTLTEAGTGLPVEGFLAPYSTPSVCALDSATEERIKCASVEAGGHYSITGLPAGTYGVSYALDWISEGLDLHPDGYVRRYWKGAPAFADAALLTGSAGTVFHELDAVLTKGEEVFPNCEVASACPPPPGSGETPPPPVVTTSTTALPGPTTTVLPPPGPHCKKGYRAVTRKGHRRCLKVPRKNKPRRAAHKVRGG